MAGTERAASGLFSTAIFRPILEGISTCRGDELTRQLRNELGISQRAANLDVVQSAYQILQSTYRSEYYYRNLLASKLFVGRHRASSRIALLNELRVGASIADCVLLNGDAVVFEIKTQLDRPEKLAGQLASYFKAFSIVNVVTHEADTARYLDRLAETPVGLWTVGSRDRLSVVKSHQACFDGLDHRVLFNLLRSAEGTAVLREWYGSVPDVPNALRHREHLALAQGIPARSLQLLVQQQLKRRVFTGERGLLLDGTLLPLRALLLQLNPAAGQRENLWRWLERSA